MIRLLTYAGGGDERAVGTRAGGIPLVGAGFDWPVCGECAGAMQFVGQILLDDLAPGREGGRSDRGLLSIFMCQNEPGLCEEWDPASGGNKALLFPSGDLVPATVPESGNTLLPEASAIAVVTVDADTYDDARTSWAKAEGRPLTDVLGQLGGIPDWVQGEEVPTCSSCGAPMGFVAQLEEGHDFATSANFGGCGCAYAFACEPCGQAGFLWQC